MDTCETSIVLRAGGRIFGFMRRSQSTEGERRALEDACACDECFRRAMDSDVYGDQPWQQRSLMIVREFAVSVYDEADILFETRVLEHWAKPIMLQLLSPRCRNREVEQTPHGPRVKAPPAAQHEVRH